MADHRISLGRLSVMLDHPIAARDGAIFALKISLSSCKQTLRLPSTNGLSWLRNAVAVTSSR